MNSYPLSVIKSVFTAVFIFLGQTLSAQPAMRPLEQLINRSDPGWALVQQWIDSAKNRVDILPADSNKAGEALYQTQVTTRSPMGAIIYSTGGLLVDHGWIRILGSGNPKLGRSLPEWNKGKSFTSWGQRPSFLLVADDAVGGFFAINGGFFGDDQGKMYYLSPDNLLWESLKMTYSEFLQFCFSADLDKFYAGLRWKNWEDDVAKLDGNMLFNFYPFLWTKEGKNISKDSRGIVTAQAQYDFDMDQIAKQAGK